VSNALAATNARFIEPGVLAWSSTRGYEGIGDDGSQLAPIGGVVVESWDVVDQEGEVERHHRCIDPYRIRPRITVHVLAESEINREALDGAMPSTLANILRRLCEEVAYKGPKRRTGCVMPEHLQLAATIHVIAGLLA
jgi:hypothetical protein